MGDAWLCTYKRIRPSLPASQPRRTSAFRGCRPGARGRGGAGCRMPQNKGASRGLSRSHLLPPGQIKEDFRGPLEEMVLFFFGKSIRPTLNRHFTSPLWESQAKVFPGPSIPVINWPLCKRRHLPVRAPSIARAP